MAVVGTLTLLFFFTILYEAIIVAATLAIADRKKLRSAILSALIEPIKLASLLFVIGTQYQLASIIIISLASGIGNYLTIWFLDRKRNVQGNVHTERPPRVREVHKGERDRSWDY